MCQEAVNGGLWAELMPCTTYSSVWISTIGGRKQADVAAADKCASHQTRFSKFTSNHNIVEYVHFYWR
ncbi:hypothetical protein K443DRAFT_675841 [Laccaria amethystina LaAM-08-1]|uniref:Uncharacterized protein n=1 Tax=Laccaria amethystina LaAM-08-1 TaxID=1095629 RepID=A0A0C9XSE1_9AGAR|nr:hypothetical protein K443DRAFT_675841 [Laccaria amethystina LaAM-08-1]